MKHNNNVILPANLTKKHTKLLVGIWIIIPLCILIMTLVSMFLFQSFFDNLPHIHRFEAGIGIITFLYGLLIPIYFTKKYSIQNSDYVFCNELASELSKLYGSNYRSNVYINDIIESHNNLDNNLSSKLNNLIYSVFVRNQDIDDKYFNRHDSWESNCFKDLFNIDNVNHYCKKYYLNIDKLEVNCRNLNKNTDYWNKKYYSQIANNIDQLNSILLPLIQWAGVFERSIRTRKL